VPSWWGFCIWGLVLAEAGLAVGVLFSQSGPYAALGREGYAGAMTAIAEVNEQQGLRITAEVRDPQGATERYAPLARDIFANTGARHIVGCTTSWSRKEVIPVLEKSGTLLWYPCPYEGFECNEQVIYLGACPNQHVLPLLGFIIPRFGGNGYLVGSNYIWGWETSRIAREIIEHSGGEVAGERFVPLGDTDIARLIEEIRIKQPDFILNTLIGPSCYAFLRAYHELGERDPNFAPDVRPIVSCNFAEAEATALGAVVTGQYVIAPYFETLDTDANRRFLAVARRLNTQQTDHSAFFAQAYAAVHMLAAAIARAGTDAPEAVRAAAMEADVLSPFGPLALDRATNHAVLTPRIGRADGRGGFEIVSESATSIMPDPYLAHSALAIGSANEARTPYLRVIK
jgi:branched-chain amino acid transport system substrate-binding protein